jgi:PAS domain S-box-containing protein
MRAAALPLLAFAVVAALSLWAWLRVAQIEERRSRERVAAAADAVQTAIESLLRTHLGVFVRSAERVAALPADQHERLFRADARLHQRDFGGVATIVWVEPGGTVRWVAGPPLVESWEGSPFAINGARRDVLRDVAQARAPRLSPVMPLRHGVPGVLFVLPMGVPGGSAPVGYYAVGLEIEPLLGGVLRTTAADYAIEIAEDGRTFFRRGAAAAEREAWVETRVASSFGRVWTIVVRPTARAPGRFAPELPDLILLSGLLTAALLALGLGFAAASRRRADAAERVAEALHASQDRLARAYRVGRLGSWSLDLAHDTAGWSDELRELLGVDASVLPTVGSTLKLVHPHDRAAVADAVAKLRAGQPSLDVTVRFVRPDDGRTVWLHAVAETQVDARGTPTGVIGVAQDVTPLMQAVERLRKSEALLSRAQRVGRLGGWTRRVDEDAGLVSPELYALFALDPDVFAPTSAAMIGLIEPPDRPAIVQALQALTERGTPIDRVVRARRATGATFWMRMVAELMPDESGDGQVIVGIAQDVTEQHDAYERLRASEAALATAQRIAHMGSWQVRVGAQGGGAGTVAWSDETYRLFGYEPGEVAIDAERFYAHVHPEDRDAVRANEARALAGGEYAPIDFRVVARDGRARVVHQEAQVLRDADGAPAGLLGTVQDITARKAGEAALAKTLADLELRNEELQSFAFAASHDLQEPLRKIQAFGDRLAARCGDALGPEGRDYLARMESAAGRMRRLIDDLLSYSRVATRAQPFAPVPLGDVLLEVLSDLETQIERSGATVRAGALPTLAADRTQMQQMLQNLVGNALKFRMAERAPVVDVGAAPFGRDGARWWRLTVADNGIGFEERFRERIFAPFQRLHGRHEYEGTGIGLAIVRRIVERHGGHVEAHGRPGAGALFVVELPEGECPMLEGSPSP